MNYPNATADEWIAAVKMIYRYCTRHGVQTADAEDAAHNVVVAAQHRRYRNRPESLKHAAGRAVRVAKRFGLWTLLTTADRARRRRALDPVPVREIAPPAADPARVAICTEHRTPSRRKLADALGVDQRTVALWTLGYGTPDTEDRAPLVTDCGPGYTPPTRGLPAQPGDGTEHRGLPFDLDAEYARAADRPARPAAEPRPWWQA
jgi:hypothetical protein